MSKSRNTRRALLSSALVIVMCLAMLIGATFAWFTDTATTSVNTIKSGKLDVQLVDASGVSLEGAQLSWVTQDNAKVDTIYWEPGCTYQLQDVIVKNNGDLALKYKIVITGINGDAKLNEVIQWTINGLAVDTEYTLPANQQSEPLRITGTMDTSADDTYQGLSIDGIAITVIATQDTKESDSNDATYDTLSEYPVYASVTTAVERTQSGETAAQKTLTTTETGKDTIAAVASVTVAEGTKLADGATSLTLVVKEDTTPSNMKVESSTQTAKTFEIDIEGLDNENTKPVKVELFVGKNLENFALYHDNTAMVADDSAAAVTADNHYYYDSGTGIVTMAVKSFSPFTFVCYKESTVAQLKIKEILAAQKNGTDGAASMTVTIDGVEFYVLGEENGKALLLSKDVDKTIKTTYNSDSSKMRFTYAANPTSAWKDSAIREYVNGEYLSNMPVLSSIVASTTIYTANNRVDSETTYDATTDKVFILSEADIWGTANTVATTEEKEYTLSDCKTIAAELQDTAEGYWYRSPGTIKSTGADAHMSYMNSTNKKYSVAVGTKMQNVRPAMWVTLGD